MRPWFCRKIGPSSSHRNSGVGGSIEKGGRRRFVKQPVSLAPVPEVMVLVVETGDPLALGELGAPFGFVPYETTVGMRPIQDGEDQWELHRSSAGTGLGGLAPA
jgi:hypothetical protein